MADPVKGHIETNWTVLGAVASVTFTVPAGKRWVFEGAAYVERDQSGTLNMKITDGINDILPTIIDEVAAGTTNVTFPLSGGTNRANDQRAWAVLKGLVLEAGWEIIFTWGATQTTPEVSCLIREYDI